MRECVERLDSAGLIAKPGAANFTRVVVEKPIGTDLASALEINRMLHEHFDESQIFRIDHYLGKETVQNLLVLRFANAIFERLWGARNVDHVQITVAESEGRGFARDVLTIPRVHCATWCRTISCSCSRWWRWSRRSVSTQQAIREAKLNVLRALRPLAPGDARKNTVRGRYSPGIVDGDPVPGYLEEQGISPRSRTETYVAVKLWIDNWRWAGVPFYIRTGKRLPARESLICVQFKDVPQILFNRGSRLPPNTPDDPDPARRGVFVRGAGQGAGPGPVDSAGADESALRE